MECFKVFKKNWINFRNKPPHSKWFKFRVFNHFTTISRNSRKKLLIPKNFLSYLRNNEWCIFLESETLRLVNALILMHFLQMKKKCKIFVFNHISLFPRFCVDNPSLCSHSRLFSMYVVSIWPLQTIGLLSALSWSLKIRWSKF